jgi:ABC-type bacteriocin/lantibiotic exporter with double-glycine peptidase domain
MRASLMVLVAPLMASCSAYVGGAKNVDPARIDPAAGWVVANAPLVLQQDVRDCGAAALSMVAARWGVRITVEDLQARLAEQAGPGEAGRGSKLGELRAVARSEGLEAFAIPGSETILGHELRQGRPVIVGLLLPHRRGRARTHYEVVVGMQPTTKEVATLDPALGWRVRAWKDLEREWEPVGRPSLVVVGLQEGQRAVSPAHGRTGGPG